MKNFKWIALALVAVLLVSAVADDAQAQARRRGGQPGTSPTRGGFTPYPEISAHYGSMWGGSLDLTYNQWAQSHKLRLGTGESWGVQLDYNTDPMSAIELSYTHQSGSMDYDYQGITTLYDMSVNFWHIGGLRYLAPPGSMRPFVMASIGATYFSPQDATFELPDEDGETYYTSSATKLSFTLGLGIKAYFGEAQKFGLRATFKTLPTLYDAGGGIYFGTGGGGITVGGYSVWQWEAAIGLTVKMG